MSHHYSDLALAAGSRRAKTPQAVECAASQSGPQGNAHISILHVSIQGNKYLIESTFDGFMLSNPDLPYHKIAKVTCSAVSYGRFVQRLLDQDFVEAFR